MSATGLTQHLIVCDGTVAVDVIQLESPAQLLVQTSSGGNAERADKFLEVNGAVFVLVEHIEDVFGKRRRITEGEELFVNAAELLLVQCSGRAVLEETLVPLLQLLAVNYREQDVSMRGDIARSTKALTVGILLQIR